ncbi:MAG: hydroxysqualene dehydroxylase HpnE [Magnetospiraceae bacterium]
MAEIEQVAHIIGAGMAGLAAACAASARGWHVVLYEAAPMAGGRCRSYPDKQLDRVLDNGTHLLLGAYEETFVYLRRIGAAQGLTEWPAAYPMAEPGAALSWTVRLEGALRDRWRDRPPGVSATTLLSDIWRLKNASPRATVADCVGARSPALRRLWEPMTLAILNTAPEKASAQLLWAAISKGLLGPVPARKPFIAQQGLGTALVDPALNWLRDRGAEIFFGTRLTGIHATRVQVAGLVFTSMEIPVEMDDIIILAVPPNAVPVSLGLIPAPLPQNEILNLHFKLPQVTPLPGGAPFRGLVGTQAQWVFQRGDVVSVTISDAAHSRTEHKEAIAAAVWSEIAPLLGLTPEPMPPHRLIREKAATVAQTPDFAAARPGPVTRYNNLFLAGDWTDTGLPATIESAVLSGHLAVAAAGDIK